MTVQYRTEQDRTAQPRLEQRKVEKTRAEKSKEEQSGIYMNVGGWHLIHKRENTKYYQVGKERVS